uniref:Sorting nexin 6 n=1 Tax=Anolis carolinensis TaxID=28377 RepID=G1KAW0_ANOCA
MSKPGPSRCFGLKLPRAEGVKERARGSEEWWELTSKTPGGPRFAHACYTSYRHRPSLFRLCALRKASLRLPNSAAAPHWLRCRPRPFKPRPLRQRGLVGGRGLRLALLLRERRGSHDGRCGGSRVEARAEGEREAGEAHEARSLTRRPAVFFPSPFGWMPPPVSRLEQEGSDDGPDFLSEEDRGLRAVTVDLQTDAALQVDISDALSERDKVKFTVHTKSSLPNFKQNEFSVVRQHEEFIWLHDSFVENEDYAGYIIPPAPPRPDFDASREKLQKLGEGEGSMTKEEFTKMKQELEAEYLAIFKKTVAMHEVFLCRVAAHPILRKDLNFHVFLEYNQDLSVRGKNKKEKLEDFFKNMVKSADGVIVSGVKDVDDFFEHERTFLVEYHNRVKDSSMKSDKMTRSHKNVADDCNRIGSSLYTLGTQDSTDICKFFLKVSELFDKTRKIEARVSADEDLKLSDLLKYYLRESQAAKDLLYRRSRSLVDYENANKALDKARAKNKDVLQAETTQQICCQKFEKISESAKQELIDFKTRRVAAFRKNLVELAELELKHAKGNLQLLQSCLAVLNGDT